MADEPVVTAESGLPAVEPMPDPIVFIGSSRVTKTEILPSGLIRAYLHEPSGVPPELDFTAEQYEAVKSATPYEDGRISIKKWNMFIAKTILLLMENNMQMGDMSYVLGRLRESLQNNFEIGVAKKFGVKDQDFITLQQIDEVLKSN